MKNLYFYFLTKIKNSVKFKLYHLQNIWGTAHTNQKIKRLDEQLRYIWQLDFIHLTNRASLALIPCPEV